MSVRSGLRSADRRLLVTGGSVLTILLVLLLAGAVAFAPSPGGLEPLDGGAWDADWEPVERTSPVPPADDTPSCPPATANSSSADGHTEPRIVEGYPNPTARGNVGEFVVIERPPADGPTNLTITDGHASGSVSLPSNETRVAVSLDPDETRPLTEYPVVEIDGHVRFAADGDDLVLEDDGGPVDAISYDRAPEGSVWYRGDERDDSGEESGEPTAADGSWWPREATCLSVQSREVTEVTSFVLPDAPEAPLEAIDDADDHVRLAGYTFTDEAVTETLLDATDRGVTVEVLVDASPVGGTPASTAPVLDDLAEAGVNVSVVGGESSRYAFHHPKYAVADETVLVMTENWKPSGVGGASSRGWGVKVPDPDLASDLGSVFDADVSGRDTSSWTDHRAGTTFVDDEEVDRSYPSETDPATLEADEVELLLSPDNAEERIEELIETAESELLITQVQIGGPDFSLLEAALEAARSGVTVRVLLDDSWYVAEDNERLVEHLQAMAAAESLPLEARLVGETNQFGKIHTKGVVVDRETAVVGSMNWNDHAMGKNREVGLAIHGSEPAAYYAGVFEADWVGDGGDPLPIELIAFLAALLTVALLAGRRSLSFAIPTASGLTSRPRPVTIEPTTSEPSRSMRTDVDDPASSRTSHPGRPVSADAVGAGLETGRARTDRKAGAVGRPSMDSHCTPVHGNRAHPNRDVRGAAGARTDRAANGKPHRRDERTVDAGQGAGHVEGQGHTKAADRLLQGDTRSLNRPVAGGRSQPSKPAGLADYGERGDLAELYGRGVRTERTGRDTSATDRGVRTERTAGAGRPDPNHQCRRAGIADDHLVDIPDHPGSAAECEVGSQGNVLEDESAVDGDRARHRRGIPDRRGKPD